MNKKKISPEKSPEKEMPRKQPASICANIHCKLRKAGCKGYEGCPGYKGKG